MGLDFSRWEKMTTIAPACADRSCGTPKPGGSYETGADGTGGWPWMDRGHAVESWQETTSTEVRLKAHIFLGENRHAPSQMNYFWMYCNSPNGYAHSNCTAILCKGVWSIRKVTVPMPKPIAMRHHR